MLIDSLLLYCSKNQIVTNCHQYHFKIGKWLVCIWQARYVLIISTLQNQHILIHLSPHGGNFYFMLDLLYLGLMLNEPLRASLHNRLPYKINYSFVRQFYFRNLNFYIPYRRFIKDGCKTGPYFVTPSNIVCPRGKWYRKSTSKSPSPL